MAPCTSTHTEVMIIQESGSNMANPICRIKYDGRLLRFMIRFIPNQIENLESIHFKFENCVFSRSLIRNIFRSLIIWNGRYMMAGDYSCLWFDLFQILEELSIFKVSGYVVLDIWKFKVAKPRWRTSINDYLWTD